MSPEGREPVEPSIASELESGWYAEAIVKTTRTPLIVLDSLMRIRVANSPFSRLVGLEPRETLGRSLFSLGDRPWDIPRLRELLARVLTEGEAFEDFRVEHGFGEVGRRSLRVNARRIRDESTGVERVVVSMEDDTRLRESTRRLREYASERRRRVEELRRSNRDLEQFASVASHDLQAPLRTIASFLRLLERRYGDDLEPDAREFIGYAVAAATRMKRMIRSLLSYSRASTRELERAPVELDDVLDDVLANLRARIESSGAAIDRGPLPRVEGDRAHLERLLQNLVENALANRDEDPPRIRLSAEETGDTGDTGAMWRITVADEGRGIDPADRERIFAMFEQLGGDDRARGTGMGLALSRKIVERHGGEISVESEPGRGAAFSFTLPRVSPGESAAGEEPGDGVDASGSGWAGLGDPGRGSGG